MSEPSPAPPRSVAAHYIDPLSHIWLTAATELGLRVRRSPHGYATTDGNGSLSIAPDGDLDADDCLAQIILHELCHALVQGPSSFSMPDWGLSNDMEEAEKRGDFIREHACLRVQAALAQGRDRCPQRSACAVSLVFGGRLGTAVPTLGYANSSRIGVKSPV